MNKRMVFAFVLVPFLCVAKNEDLATFDFCGIPDSVCDVSNLSARIACEDLTLNGHELLSYESQQYALGASMAFKALLSAAEMRACVGDRASYCAHMESVADLLCFLSKNAKIAGWAAYESNVARTEYSLARIINGKAGVKIAVTAGEVKRWLPETDGKSTKEFVNLNRFRALLVIGAAIEQYKREHNHLPENLQTLVDEKTLGVLDSDLSSGGLSIEYRKGPDFWKLRLGRYERRVPEPLEDFIPAVFQIAGSYVDEVWFASSYSQKRKELFARGYLPSEDSYCRCSIKGPIVIRGGGASPKDDKQ